MGIFLNVLTYVVCFLSGFYYGVWFMQRKYVDCGRKLLLVFDSDAYTLDFLIGSGITLNTLFDNKLDCDVKLALTRKILDSKKGRKNS